MIHSLQSVPPQVAVGQLTPSVPRNNPELAQALGIPDAPRKAQEWSRLTRGFLASKMLERAALDREIAGVESLLARQQMERREAAGRLMSSHPGASTSHRGTKSTHALVTV